MNKTISILDVQFVVSELHNQGKSIVLTGGVFDILHRGHIEFLKSAKKLCDIHFVLLESDESTKERKGSNRPINSQKHRSIVLEALDSVDYIVLLEGVTRNNDYDKLIVQIKPNVIAITEGDRNIKQRKNQANMVNAKLLSIKKKENPSTTDLINKLHE